MADKYLGVDIGGTAIKIGTVDQTGKVSGIETFSDNFDGYDTPILTTVIKSITEYEDKYDIADGSIRGIGVSATGGIDTKNGVVSGCAGHIKNWEGSQVGRELENRFHADTCVINDANAAALGEVWIGAAKGRKDVVAVTVGTGIGGGIIVDGNILLGAHGFAGEIGHFPIQCEGEECTCGNIGCLEHYASTTALVKMVRSKVADGTITGYVGEVNGKTIFEQIRNGNKKVESVTDRWIGYFAAGIIGYVHTFNPGLVLIGGGVSAQKELFIDKVRDRVLTHVMPRFADNLEIRAAELGNEAGIVGAVYYLIRHGKGYI